MKLKITFNMVWSLAVTYALIAAAVVYAVYSGSPFNVFSGAMCAANGALWVACTFYMLNKHGQLPHTPGGLFRANVIVAMVWIFIETCLTCVLAIYGATLVYERTSLSSAAIGLVFLLFPLSFHTLWKEPDEEQAQEAQTGSRTSSKKSSGTSKQGSQQSSHGKSGKSKKKGKRKGGQNRRKR